MVSPLDIHPLPQSTIKEIQPCSLEAAHLGHWAGKRVQRKQGAVEYLVVGAGRDDSFRPAYNFTNFFVLLRRLSGGSATRPAGSFTLIPDGEFRYHFEEITCA
jgi:hypothetical protein